MSLGGSGFRGAGGVFGRAALLGFQRSRRLRICRVLLSRREIEKRFAMTKAYQDILLYVNDRAVGSNPTLMITVIAIPCFFIVHCRVHFGGYLVVYGVYVYLLRSSSRAPDFERLADIFTTLTIIPIGTKHDNAHGTLTAWSRASRGGARICCSVLIHRPGTWCHGTNFKKNQKSKTL